LPLRGVEHARHGVDSCLDAERTVHAYVALCPPHAHFAWGGWRALDSLRNVRKTFSVDFERVLKANKPLTGPNMKEALESLGDWDSGGISGLPVNLKGHQIATGRIYRFDTSTKLYEPASGWIRTV
jgi:hypothetical protein